MHPIPHYHDDEGADRQVSSIITRDCISRYLTDSITIREVIEWSEAEKVDANPWRKCTSIVSQKMLSLSTAPSFGDFKTVLRLMAMRAVRMPQRITGGCTQAPLPTLVRCCSNVRGGTISLIRTCLGKQQIGRQRPLKEYHGENLFEDTTREKVTMLVIDGVTELNLPFEMTELNWNRHLHWLMNSESRGQTWTPGSITIEHLHLHWRTPPVGPILRPEWKNNHRIAILVPRICTNKKSTICPVRIVSYLRSFLLWYLFLSVHLSPSSSSRFRWRRLTSILFCSFRSHQLSLPFLTSFVLLLCLFLLQIELLYCQYLLTVLLQ